MPPPLYQFCVDDMEPDHRVVLACACGHVGIVDKQQLLAHPRISGSERVLGLRFYLRCAMCRKKGRVDITLKRLTPF